MMSNRDTKSKPNRIAVVGLGLLGRGIATCLLGNGFQVVGCDLSAESLQGARNDITKGLGELAAETGAKTVAVDEWLARYQNTCQLDALKSCDFVIESVVEDVAVKQKVFDGIERFVDKCVPIASNTSSIRISHLQEGRNHPERFLGTHWFEPAYATRFLELIPGEHTSQAVMQVAIDLAHRCGKDPSVLQKDIPGFVVNRLAYALYREACHLVELGVADVETIDRSFRNTMGVWSTVCGPFQWMDLTGGPTLYANCMRTVLPTLSDKQEVPEPARRLAERDAHGVVNGNGFYSYTQDQADLAVKRFHEHAWRAGRMLSSYFPLEEE